MNDIEMKRWLLEEGGDDPLLFAARTIIELVDSTSFGYIRAVPYKEVMPPKDPPPPAIGAEYDKMEVSDD